MSYKAIYTCRPYWLDMRRKTAEKTGAPHDPCRKRTVSQRLFCLHMVMHMGIYMVMHIGIHMAMHMGHILVWHPYAALRHEASAPSWHGMRAAHSSAQWACCIWALHIEGGRARGTVPCPASCIRPSSIWKGLRPASSGCGHLFADFPYMCYIGCRTCAGRVPDIPGRPHAHIEREGDDERWVRTGRRAA